MHGCHLWADFHLHSCLVGKIIWLSQAQFGKVQIVSKAQNWFSARLIANLGFTREHARENDHSIPLLENNSPLDKSRALTPQHFNAHFHPTVSATSHVLPFHSRNNTHDLTPKLTLPLRPAEMVSMRGYRGMKGQSVLKKKQQKKNKVALTC